MAKESNVKAPAIRDGAICLDSFLDDESERRRLGFGPAPLEEGDGEVQRTEDPREMAQRLASSTGDKQALLWALKSRDASENLRWESWERGVQQQRVRAVRQRGADKTNTRKQEKYATRNADFYVKVVADTRVIQEWTGCSDRDAAKKAREVGNATFKLNLGDEQLKRLIRASRGGRDDITLA